MGASSIKKSAGFAAGADQQQSADLLLEILHESAVFGYPDGRILPFVLEFDLVNDAPVAFVPLDISDFRAWRMRLNGLLHLFRQSAKLGAYGTGRCQRPLDWASWSGHI